jgi:hypothetical protein
MTGNLILRPVPATGPPGYPLQVLAPRATDAALGFPLLSLAGANSTFMLTAAIVTTYLGGFYVDFAFV